MSQFEREGYLLRAKLDVYKRRVESAVVTAKEALSVSTKPALSFSAGKDSVVMLDIAIKAGFRGKLVFFKYGIITDVETPKENIELLKSYAE